MAKDQTKLGTLSRRTILGAASVSPLACTIKVAARELPETLIGSCAQWLTLDFESDRLARRWSALETEAAGNFDYFRMNERERLSLPMGPEMGAIEKELDVLFGRRKRLYRAITRMTPATIHEAASLIVIAARIEVHDPGPTAPLVRKALDFIARGTCPRCGEAYVPKNLPTA
ncbi:MAG: hypothetical protein LCH78_21610 [Proteobacteria bacterium]|nr:hypothetical protein [Pseudomonadota bacterium]